MKKKNYLSLIVLGFLMFIFPFTVKAKEAVTIYFFKGETCSYCHAALTFLESLKNDEEYQGKFVVKEYEVWNNKANNSLMEKVAKKMGDTLEGVPYFIIGDKTWNGYASSYDEAIKEQILKIYNDESYVDELKAFIAEGSNESGDNSTLITVSIIAGVVVIAGIALFLARRDSDDEEMIEEQKSEPLKEEPKAKEVQETKKVEKKIDTKEQTKTTKESSNTSSKKTSPKKQENSSTKKSNSTKKTSAKKNTSKKTK